MKKVFLVFLTVMISFELFSGNNDRWSELKANQWYAHQPWISGCNFQPSSAINQIEMWQNDSFDSTTIDEELTWAHELGFNTMRVFLSSVVYTHEPEIFKKNINQYLEISSRYGIKTIFVFFDDCWNDEAHIGKQPDPKPGVHNSGWVKDPSVSLRNDTLSTFPQLEKYVSDIINTFKSDKRILCWDLYNEPGNSDLGLKSFPLLRNVFKCARKCNPTQPLTSGIWNLKLTELNRFQIENSDILTYHNYSNEKEHEMWINFLKIYNRPMICTEYMARKNNSRFENIFPLLRKNNVGAINWGFVSGKTNTIFSWDEKLPDQKEPKLWFHDILRKDKTAFDDKEIELIKSINNCK
ncbi:MAG TPA: 1,4-beta-xylanase [Paludibacter sp.]